MADRIHGQPSEVAHPEGVRGAMQVWGELWRPPPSGGPLFHILPIHHLLPILGSGVREESGKNTAHYHMWQCEIMGLILVSNYLSLFLPGE